MISDFCQVLAAISTTFTKSSICSRIWKKIEFFTEYRFPRKKIFPGEPNFWDLMLKDLIFKMKKKKNDAEFWIEESEKGDITIKDRILAEKKEKRLIN